MNRAGRTSRPLACQGLSLLECLVGLALGLVVVAAVLQHHLSTGQSARLQAAQAQMSEDAQIALQLLVSELQMAGHAAPAALETAADGGPRWRTPLMSAPLFACDAGFVSASTTAEVICAPSGNSAALEVRYQADEFSTVPLSGTTRPSDCLGNGLSATDGIYLTRNRWYVATSQGRTELRCASRLGNPGQPLVDNVEALAFWFGVAATPEGDQPVRYARASQVGDFAAVRSVRLCVLLRSSEPVLAPEDVSTYLDCEGQALASADRRLRRTFHATTALRNRSGG